MKTRILTLCASLLAVLPLRAQVEVLPPDFVLFGKTGGDYVAEWYQWLFNLPGDNDFYLPAAGPWGEDSDRVFNLQRIATSLPTRPGIQNYYVPDDVYLFFPVLGYEADNIDIVPPLSVEQLIETATANIDLVEDIHAWLDDVEVPNLFSYRFPSPVFGVYVPTTNNLFSGLFGHPIQGLIYPVVADGYFLMLAPMPVGTHDVKTRVVVGGPNGFSFQRHYLINVLSPHEYLAYQTRQVLPQMTNSALPAHRQHPLLVSLQAAEASFTSNNLTAAINQLQAFLNKLRAQVAPAQPALAEELAQSVTPLIEKATRRLRE